MDKNTAGKIIALKNADLTLREKLIRDGKLGTGYNEEMQDLHNRNAGMLEEIIAHTGYPTADKVGEEGSEAAWLIVQHSIGRPDFMRKCLKLLESSVPKSNAEIINLAYLTDRIAVFEDRPQLYGTQFDWDENRQLSPAPCDNPDRVNQRRISIGLNTLEEQTLFMRNRAQQENQHPPADLKKRKAETEAWKKSVGWTVKQCK